MFLISIGLHGIASHEAVVFIVAAVRTSNLTNYKNQSSNRAILNRLFCPLPHRIKGKFKSSHPRHDDVWRSGSKAPSASEVDTR